MQADATKNALGGTLKTFQVVIKEGGVRSGQCHMHSYALKEGNVQERQVKGGHGCCRALWNGTGPTIWRLSVGLGLQMSVLEGLKECFARMHMRSEMGREHSGVLVCLPCLHHAEPCT